jgi:soluble lytic murein transglycosylase-like protein
MEFMNRIQEIEGRISDIQNRANSIAPPVSVGGSDFNAILQQEIEGVQGPTNLPAGCTAWDGTTPPTPAGPTEAAPSGAMPATIGSAQFDSAVADAASQNSMDPNLVKSVIQQESAFNPKAVSSCGAMGLMQLMPETAKALGCGDAFDPVQNIQAGTKYLKSLMDRFHGDTSLALAAYNAGAGAVEKYNGVPPFAETQNYVKNILANYQAYKRG